MDDFGIHGRGTVIRILDSAADFDGDGETNGAELAAGTDPVASDVDRDGIPDAHDNCLRLRNADQRDAVHPGGPGDACDDPDGDGVADLDDNCPDTANAGQTDDVHPGGGGDACDDPDADGLFDLSDNCADLPNPDQGDLDGDGVGDACDVCTSIANPQQGNSMVCLSVTPGLGECARAQLASFDGDLQGEVRAVEVDYVLPTSIAFEFLGTSCDAPDAVTFYLNGTRVARETVDPLRACAERNERHVAIVEDDELIASLWNSGGDNRFAVEKRGGGSHVSRTIVRLARGELERTLCVQGNCRFVENSDPTEERLLPFFVERTVADPLYIERVVSSVPWSDTTPDAVLDLARLPSGPSRICAAVPMVKGLYGTAWGDTVVRLDLGTGSVTEVFSADVDVSRGLDHDPLTDRLFASSDGTRIVQLHLPSGETAVETVHLARTLDALEHVGETLYAARTELSGHSELVILHPLEGRFTSVGPMAPQRISGMAYDSRSETMYAVGGYGWPHYYDPSSLYVVDLATGEMALVGPLDFSAYSLQFDSDGQLYASGGVREIYRIDPATAETTLVTTLDSGVDGLTLIDGGFATECVDFVKTVERYIAINDAECSLPRRGERAVPDRHAMSERFGAGP
ncbi:MAG: hypothetical protein GY716_16645 [bacterium]|nr:hypothetical protein [bacterium]